MPTVKEYVQFSKRLTRWGMTTMTITLMACLAIIAFCGLEQHSTSAIVSLYTAFSAVVGVIVGAYQGNSSLEKWVRGKYKIDKLLKGDAPDDEESAVG